MFVCVALISASYSHLWYKCGEWGITLYVLLRPPGELVFRTCVCFIYSWVLLLCSVALTSCNIINCFKEQSSWVTFFHSCRFKGLWLFWKWKLFRDVLKLRSDWVSVKTSHLHKHHLFYRDLSSSCSFAPYFSALLYSLKEVIVLIEPWYEMYLIRFFLSCFSDLSASYPLVGCMSFLLDTGFYLRIPVWGSELEGS